VTVGGRGGTVASGAEAGGSSLNERSGDAKQAAAGDDGRLSLKAKTCHGGNESCTLVILVREHDDLKLPVMRSFTMTGLAYMRSLRWD